MKSVRNASRLAPQRVRIIGAVVSLLMVAVLGGCATSAGNGGSSGEASAYYIFPDGSTGSASGTYQISYSIDPLLLITVANGRMALDGETFNFKIWGGPTTGAFILTASDGSLSYDSGWDTRSTRGCSTDFLEVESKTGVFSGEVNGVGTVLLTLRGPHLKPLYEYDNPFCVG